ncbi:hypothetical protein CKA32_000699 [Geitlerinema sp. FC II]|nr:hypothetical protein CKA32_000699 [Geitlerinema sp. FC II]
MRRWICWRKSYPFQSLEGIFGFFNFGDRGSIAIAVVSIPRRDFWVFQLFYM